ncbi:hypothetical protein RDWZM_005989 [Blomia tropicalis]|uniref:Gamma-aminobutyric acid receptor subunit beta n=1 Tax=Blomia tropicalis TaxID=40697 RepID=A0A9Q0M716_BLOTA|nr:hypothetical protein RDWZM_005989 [Blomia tropicalis]
MHIISISSISEVQMDFTSDFYFRQGWRDPRLSFKPRPGIDALFVGAEVAKLIWVPDTFFANEKSALFHMATTPNTFIRIRSNGDVLRSTRLTVTSSCPMNLQYFPMDRQMCTIEVESYGYSMADIMYKWGIDGKGSVGISDVVELPQFKIKGLTQKTKIEVLSTGNYSRLVCELEFVRSMGYYLIQIYIPASLIVIISWVSFWLHRNASPARVQLGVTTVLTMTTLMSSTNAALPKISYIKSIDVYLGTCFVMVFASLLEYATVGYMGKRIAMRKTRSQQMAKQLQNRAMQMKSMANHNVEIGRTMGSHTLQHHHQQQPPSSICYSADPISMGQPSPRGRNSIANAPEMRYRMIGNAPTSGAIVGPAGLETKSNRASFDYSKKKMSLAPPDSDAEGASGAPPAAPPPPDAATPGTPPPAIPIPGVKNQNTLFGVCPSDIDKYSRVVFPVCFLCFNLMYWIIYMHISEFFTGEFEE